MSRVLTILEVSQKQAYIFSSNKLRDNIENSATIARVTGSAYIEASVNDPSLYTKENNLVYSGGGHTILEFPDMTQARIVTSKVTECVLKDYPGIELFAKSVEYDENKTPDKNVKELTAALEIKKSHRLASFYQKTFGVEQIDQSTGKIVYVNEAKPIKEEIKEWVPKGFCYTNKLEELGDSEQNFIAVVHIDGNAMGKRVDALATAADMNEWDTYKKNSRAFSEGIAEDFGAAYRIMEEQIIESMKSASFVEKFSCNVIGDEMIFPVRRIISEGDDICFIANGQIGIECAVAFLKALSGRVNCMDHKNYAACAGVALVHQKYPFYKAYELAEELCSNAKRFGASLGDGTGSDISCIDWHIEYGELQDTLKETRKMYLTDDGKNLEMRPYWVIASEEEAEKEPTRTYSNFRNLFLRMEKKDFFGRGLLKGLRSVLKQGEYATQHYLTYHKAETLLRDAYQGTYKAVDYEKTEVGSGKQLEAPAFVQTFDKKERSTLFDAIEIADNFIMLEDM